MMTRRTTAAPARHRTITRLLVPIPSGKKADKFTIRQMPEQGNKMGHIPPALPNICIIENSTSIIFVFCTIAAHVLPTEKMSTWKDYQSST
jgi:hypothetical protein